MSILQSAAAVECDRCSTELSPIGPARSRRTQVVKIEVRGKMLTLCPACHRRAKRTDAGAEARFFAPFPAEKKTAEKKPAKK